jgi:tetratricopeptide (TPR) repeat protein
MERSIAYLCSTRDIWRKYFGFLENDYSAVDFLKTYYETLRKMIRCIDVELVFGEADFFESQGDIKEAGHIYEDLASWNKEDVYIIIRWEQFLIRQNRIEEAKSLFNSSLGLFSGTSAAVFLDQMSSFYTKVLGDPEAMVALYKKEVEKSPKFNRHLLMAYLNILMTTETKLGENLAQIVELFDVLIPRMKDVSHFQGKWVYGFIYDWVSQQSEEAMVGLTKIYLEYMRSSGAEIGIIRKLEEK